MTNDSFLWGVATSAFQLEGSASADWASWDPLLSSKPHVTDHYHLYRQDLKLLSALGVNAYRFSIEWSRIQPEEHQWDDQALNHYQEIIDVLRENGIEPMVTLHHFTHPRWFVERYPWHQEAAVSRCLSSLPRTASPRPMIRRRSGSSRDTSMSSKSASIRGWM
jgi:beta-glucosidase